MASLPPNLSQLTQPTNPALSASAVASGPPILPIKVIASYDPDEWEQFVLEWATSYLGKEYKRVLRHGGSGDLGRDIVAVAEDGSWDNFQCKHLANPLAPSDVWTEFGKLIHYTFIGEFDVPRRYVFVAPRGAGPTLSNLLMQPGRIAAELTANWGKYCETKVTAKMAIPLSSDLAAYIDDFDFSIFSSLGPNVLLDQHAKTHWYVARFGGGLPARPEPQLPPAVPTQDEAPYVRALLDAYGDHLGVPIDTHLELDEEKLMAHFGEARREFYTAESLRAFSRDRLPPNTFDALQDEVFSGIGDDMRDDHPDGYRRVLAVVKTARGLALTGHPLSGSLHLRDRGGICHQLANDGSIKGWLSE